MLLLKKLFVVLILGGLIYCNVDALLYASKIKIRKSESRELYLPNHWIPRHIFNSFGLYGGWSNSSVGYEAWVRKEATSEVIGIPTKNEIKINIYDYFRQALGEANRRLYLLSYRGNPKKVKRKYTKLCEQVLKIYNKENPNAPMAQLFLYRVEWPKSKEGYFSEYEKRIYYLLGKSS